MAASDPFAPFYLGGELIDPLVEMGAKAPPSAGNASVGLFQPIPSTWEVFRG